MQNDQQVTLEVRALTADQVQSDRDFCNTRKSQNHKMGVDQVSVMANMTTQRAPNHVKGQCIPPMRVSQLMLLSKSTPKTV